MSEFELKPEDLRRKVLTKWKCGECGEVCTSFEGKPNECRKCASKDLKKVINVNTVPVTTGIEIEYQYDNLDSIDEFIEKENATEEQNKNLKKLEKERR